MAADQLSRTTTVTPTISLSAYASGDQVGDLMTFNLTNSFVGGVLAYVVITDKAKQNADLELWLFNEEVTITSTDNNAADISDANVVKCKGVIEIPTTEYKDLVNNSVATIGNQTIIIEEDSTRPNRPRPGILYGLLVTRGTPTYSSTSDLQVRIGVLSD